MREGNDGSGRSVFLHGPISSLVTSRPLNIALSRPFPFLIIDASKRTVLFHRKVPFTQQVWASLANMLWRTTSWQTILGERRCVHGRVEHDESGRHLSLRIQPSSSVSVIDRSFLQGASFHWSS